MKKELLVELAKYRLATGNTGVFEHHGVIVMNKVIPNDGTVSVPRFINIVGDTARLKGLPDYDFSVKIPSEVSMINEKAFARSSVYDLVIESGSFQTLGVRCFEGSNIRNVSLPYGLSTIGSEAFHGCHNLESIDIPETVISIGECAFCKSGLTEVIIPPNVLTAGAALFMDCENLKVAQWQSSTSLPHSAFSASSLQGIELCDDVEDIGKFAFGSCPNLIEIKIPSSCISIGVGAFEWCVRLQTVDFSDITAECILESNAFARCSMLEHVELPSDIVLKDAVFKECIMLKRVTVNIGVNTEYAMGVFEYCSRLKYIRLAENLCTFESSDDSVRDVEWLSCFLDKDRLGIMSNISVEVPSETYDFLKRCYPDLTESSWYKMVKY